MRAGLAGVVGMTLIGIATPAWATPPEEHMTPTPTPTVTTPADPAEEPAESPSPQTSPTESASPTASPAGAAAVPASPTASATPTATDSPAPAAAATTPAPVDEDALDDLRDFMAGVGIHFPDTDDIGFEDFVVNPLGLTYTCTDDGPSWTLKNNGPAPLGVGWFDTDLGGSFTPIAGGQSLGLSSHALAVIAHPVDSEGNVLVTVPAVGVSFCDDEGAGGGAGAGVGVGAGVPAAPVSLPVAPPATPVNAEPHYTG
jgi:hypothetical protein